MILGRRTKPTLGERLRTAVWPRTSWRRSLRYFAKRVLRINSSPHTIALGFGTGVFIAWSPFFGLHYVMSAAASFVLRGNIVASIIGTTLGNPLTLPAMWLLAYKLGGWIVGDAGADATTALPDNLAQQSWAAIWPIVKLILIGSIPLGLVTGVIAYFAVRGAVTAFQEARRQRIARRRIGEESGPAAA
jgi:uncharacterized protein (DUF2062 family)